MARAVDLPVLGFDLDVDLEGDALPAVRRRLLSIVVPLLNEEATVASLYAEVRKALATIEDDWELVYVDDGSTDGSYRELVRLHGTYENVRVVRLRRNCGKAAALAAGIEVAAGGGIIHMEARLPGDPAEVPPLVEKVGRGY